MMHGPINIRFTAKVCSQPPSPHPTFKLLNHLADSHKNWYEHHTSVTHFNFVHSLIMWSASKLATAVSDPTATHQTVTGQTPKGYESRAYNFQSKQKAVSKKKSVGMGMVNSNANFTRLAIMIIAAPPKQRICAYDLKYYIYIYIYIYINFGSLGERRGAYRILVGKSEGKRPFGRPGHRQEDKVGFLMFHDHAAKLHYENKTSKCI